MLFSNRLLILVGFASLLNTATLNAQVMDKVVEFFTIHPNQKRAEQDSSLYPSKIVMAPILMYSPETSFGAGVGAKYLFKFKGSGPETRTSNMPMSVLYTLENQFIAHSGFEIFSNGERWMLTGNLRFKVFPQYYFGVGRTSSTSDREQYSSKQILAEPMLLRQTPLRYLFVGGGFRYNHVRDVEAPAEGTLFTENYTGALGSTSVGAQFAAVYDSRDNLLNANRGWFAELTHGIYSTDFGGTHNFQLTRLDLRKYISVPRLSLYSKRSAVMAFQLLTHLSFGEPPLYELATLGGSRMMRGYYEGRFLDRKLIATQFEYRTALSERVGGVLFAGVGDVASNLGDFKIQNFRASVGLGLRFLLDKRENLNIRADWGFGNSTNNYYLNIAEAY